MNPMLIDFSPRALWCLTSSTSPKHEEFSSPDSTANDEWAPRLRQFAPQDTVRFKPQSANVFSRDPPVQASFGTTTPKGDKFEARFRKNSAFAWQKLLFDLINDRISQRDAIEVALRSANQMPLEVQESLFVHLGRRVSPEDIANATAKIFLATGDDRSIDFGISLLRGAKEKGWVELPKITNKLRSELEHLVFPVAYWDGIPLKARLEKLVEFAKHGDLATRYRLLEVSDRLSRDQAIPLWTALSSHEDENVSASALDRLQDTNNQ